MHQHAHTRLHTPVLVNNKSEGEGGMEGGDGVRGLNMGQSAAALTRVAGCSSYSTSIVADASAGVSVVSTHTGEQTWPPSQPAIKCRACKLRRPQDVLGNTECQALPSAGTRCVDRLEMQGTHQCSLQPLLALTAHAP